MGIEAEAHYPAYQNELLAILPLFQETGLMKGRRRDTPTPLNMFQKLQASCPLIFHQPHVGYLQVRLGIKVSFQLTMISILHSRAEEISWAKIISYHLPFCPPRHSYTPFFPQALPAQTLPRGEISKVDQA